ncbi:MAG: hypothetical protein V4754_02320 [Pseudomonadota bacterium]
MKPYGALQEILTFSHIKGQSMNVNSSFSSTITGIQHNPPDPNAKKSLSADSAPSQKQNTKDIPKNAGRGAFDRSVSKSQENPLLKFKRYRIHKSIFDNLSRDSLESLAQLDDKTKERVSQYIENTERKEADLEMKDLMACFRPDSDHFGQPPLRVKLGRPGGGKDMTELEYIRRTDSP